MCKWYTPVYHGCHDCSKSYEGMTTGKTFKCGDPESIWSKERRNERKLYRLGNLPCDHTCKAWTANKTLKKGSIMNKQIDITFYWNDDEDKTLHTRTAIIGDHPVDPVDSENDDAIFYCFGMNEKIMGDHGGLTVVSYTPVQIKELFAEELNPEVEEVFVFSYGEHYENIKQYLEVQNDELIGILGILYDGINDNDDEILGYNDNSDELSYLEPSLFSITDEVSDAEIEHFSIGYLGYGTLTLNGIAYKIVMEQNASPMIVYMNRQVFNELKKANLDIHVFKYYMPNDAIETGVPLVSRV